MLSGVQYLIITETVKLAKTSDELAHDKRQK